jgi:hypothetical protein
MPRPIRSSLLLFSLLVFLPTCRAQSAPPPAQQSAVSPPAGPAAPDRDPQALAVLTKCVIATGGAQALGNLKDYTGKGNITYFWAGQEVNGAVTVQSARPDQFRLDANLAQGTRSWVINGGQGSIKDADGKQSTIPTFNGLALGSLTLPYSTLLQSLSDSSVTVNSLGDQIVAGKQVIRVRIQHNFLSDLDPTGDWSRWSAREFLIDAFTFQIAGTRAVLHSNDSSTREHTQEILFSDYRSVNGIAVPFSIVETIGGQKTWAIQLDSVNFNTGLTDTNFQF